MIGIFRFITVAAIAAALTTGCSVSLSPSPSPPHPEPLTTMTQGGLCDSLLTFFGKQLGAVGTNSVPLFGLNEAISPGGICTVINTESQRSNGRISLRNAPNALDPTERAVGFTKKTELNESIWVQDMRTDTKNPGIEVVFATRIGDWNGQLRITESETRTANGILHLTDEDIHKSAQFLIELTRRVSKS
ncbi:hypothetical protein [Nocardia sp. NPDC047038]|uniref:hypothetical protein n=1 Tax=Nocardia sp. NPDC047038 TaxID=3154338 RepID=UPI0033C9887E